jgi:gas vesicle protein
VVNFLLFFKKLLCTNFKKQSNLITHSCAQLYEDVQEVKSQVPEHYRELPTELKQRAGKTTEISMHTDIHRSWSRKVVQYCQRVDG